jgi:predicted SAM-dependent methyltransferase
MNRLKKSLRHLRYQGFRSWLVYWLTRGRLSPRTCDLLMFELQAARIPSKQLKPSAAASLRSRRLHFGAGSRIVSGWHNIDAFSGDERVDLRRPLPFADEAFDFAVSQHVVEHLAIEDELGKLLRELWRVLSQGGTLFVSTPDMFRLCRDYVSDGGGSWIRYYKGRHASFGIGDRPDSHMVNYVFHQNGEHKNLFDFELLSSSLIKAGFVDVEKINEAEFLGRCPEFPKRNDDDTTLYVSAIKP